MKEPRPSDEILNAFVDGEFSPEDRLLTLKLIAADEQLSREVCDRFQLKELLNAAYRDVRPRHRTTPQRPQGYQGLRPITHWMAMAASVVVLTVASVMVLDVIRESQPPPVTALAPLVANGPDLDLGLMQRVQLAPAPYTQAPTDASKLLLHVTDLYSQDAALLLDDVEYLFQMAQLQGQALNIQMVVHGTALELVRTDLSPLPLRMEAMINLYPGLRITACTQSRERSERLEGRSIQFLPWVEEIESGVREAAQRQAEGWTYIRI